METIENSQEIEIPGKYFEVNFRKKRFIFTACHQIPSRSIHYKGNPIICYRCAGINLGFIGTILLHTLALLLPILTLDDYVLSWASGSALFVVLFLIAIQLPLIFDGGIQALSDRYESKNPIRMITGLMAGIGQFYIGFFMGYSFKLLMGW